MEIGSPFHTHSCAWDLIGMEGRCDPSSKNELSQEQMRIVQELKQRDQEVRAHEQAHTAVGGAYVIGGAAYTYQVGPDGKRYATGGEVSIDTSEVPNNPEATIQKMAQVRRAAMAPKDPSAADRRVAAVASKKEAEARKEIQEEKRSRDEEDSSPPAALYKIAREAYQGAVEPYESAGGLNIAV